jgi:hypothetical protein
MAKFFMYNSELQELEQLRMLVPDNNRPQYYTFKLNQNVLPTPTSESTP